jgi:hypothetical protein
MNEKKLNEEFESLQIIENFFNEFVVKYNSFEKPLENFDEITLKELEILMNELKILVHKIKIVHIHMIGFLLLEKGDIITKLDVAIIRLFLIEISEIKEWFKIKENLSKSKN